MLEEVWGWRPRCVLVASTGGGGDAGSAAAYAEIVARHGARAVVAALPWERYVRDPCPGPLPLWAVRGAAELAPGLARVEPGQCIAHRCGRLLEPAACAAARVLRGAAPVYLLEGWLGPLGVARALEEAASLHGCEALLVFDVGGDVLACGCEEGLWSPLGDSLGLAAARHTSLWGDSVVAVHSLGADGELSEDEVLAYAALAASRGGYRWLRGIASGEKRVLEEVLSAVYTEAGAVALEALRGAYGEKLIRGGTRRLRIDIFKAATVFLDAATVYSWAAARHIERASSLEEARRMLNSLGVYTELDLEEDIRLLSLEKGAEPGPKIAQEAREQGRQRLGPCRACNQVITGRGRGRGGGVAGLGGEAGA